MPSHQDRVRRNQPELSGSAPASSPVSTAAISQFAKDIKYLLEHTDHDYADGEMTKVRRRLEHALELGL